MSLARDCTYLLILNKEDGSSTIMGTFQDEDLFVQFLNGIPKANII